MFSGHIHEAEIFSARLMPAQSKINWPEELADPHILINIYFYLSRMLLEHNGNTIVTSNDVNLPTVSYGISAHAIISDHIPISAHF